MGEEEEGGLKTHTEIVIPPYCFHLFTPFPRLGLVEKKIQWHVTRDAMA